MRKPTDPSHYGKKPEPVKNREARITLADLDNELTQEVSLETVIGAWNKALKDHESQGHRIVRGPVFASSSFYGSSLALTYEYEWDNLNYSVEKAAWDAELAQYQANLAAWKQFEKERQETLHPQKQLKTIDDQILRAERRLANLKAVKANEPLPFPQG
jgi:replication-associated recombination protein RarA